MKLRGEKEHVNEDETRPGNRNQEGGGGALFLLL